MDPASAVAASKCYLARSFPPQPEYRWATTIVNRAHQERCGWCEYTPAELLRLVRDFWRDTDERTVRRFEQLPRSEQAALVRAAQQEATA